MGDARRVRKRHPEDVTIRLAAVVGLLSAAFWAALPWLGCAWNPITKTVDLDSLRICTFGFPGLPGPPTGYGVPGFVGPYWGNLIVGIAYAIAAAVVTLKARAS